MVGIVSYGSYIPFHRLKAAEAAAAFGKRGGKSEKAVAYCDEDSLTMAVAAARDAVAGSDIAKLGSVSFASTTAPYLEKQCAAEIAAVLDVAPTLRSCDYANSLRAGSAAMIAACETAQSGDLALAAMADCRLGAADGKFENELGDAAAAFLFGSEDLLATFDGSFSISKNAIDQWRDQSDRYIHNWDVRYASAQLYTPAVKQAVSGLFDKLGLTAADFSKIAIYGNDDKTRNAAAAKLGFTPEQIVPSMYSEIGNTGCAAAALMLTSALDNAKPGDKILFVSYGEGCDALAFTVTEKAADFSPVNTVAQLLAHKKNDLPYGKYLKWKGMIDCEPQKRPAQERSSLPDFYRNYKKNYALYGCRCTECGTPVFPPQRVCVHCHAIDKMEPYCFLDKKATIRTFTIDGLSLSMDPPNYLVVIEFEGGGKMMSYLVDCNKEDIKVGMKVKPSYRKMFDANGMHTYFWKVVPAKGGNE